MYREVTDKNCTRSMYAAFPKVDVERRKRGNYSHGNDNDNDTQTIFSPGTFLNDLKNASMNEEHFVHLTRSNIMRLKKEETKQLLHCIMQLNENNVISTPKSEYLLYVVKDLCLYKYQRIYLQSNTCKQFVVIEFVNKYLNDINLNKLFNTPSVVSKFPIKNREYTTPTVCFKYTKTVRCRILKYKKTIF